MNGAFDSCGYDYKEICFHPCVRIASIRVFVFVLFAFDGLIGMLVMYECEIYELYGEV